MAKIAKRSAAPPRKSSLSRPKQPAKITPPLAAKAADGPAIPVTFTAGEFAAGAAGGFATSAAGRGERQQLVLALQQTHGNLAVNRILRHAIRRHDEGEGEAEIARQYAGPDRAAIQRHTSVELEEPENAIQRAPLQRMLIQRDLASELTAELDLFFPTAAVIYAAIDRAKPDAKTAILNNGPMMKRLRTELIDADYSVVLRKLGAPLADQLDQSIAWIWTDTVALLSAIEAPGVPAVQKLQVLRNPQLMERIKQNLDRANVFRAVRSLGGSLAEQLWAVLDAKGTDEIPIFAAITMAPQDQRLAVTRDRTLIQKLGNDLAQKSYLRALDQLGAPLAEQIDVATDGGKVDPAVVLGIIRKGDDAQRRELAVNQALLNRLRSTVDLDTMLTILTEVKASLADRLAVALDKSADKAVALITAASVDEKQQLRENIQIVDRMRGTMPKPLFAQVASLIGLPPVPQVVTVGVGAGTAAGAGGPAAGVDAISGAGPVVFAPKSLVGKISAALEQTPPDGGAALAALDAAAPAEIASVAGDRGLRERFLGALDDTHFYGAMIKLGMTLTQRLNAMIDRNSPQFMVLIQIATSAADEKPAVLADPFLMRRLLAYVGDSLRDTVLAGLGDTPVNRMEELLRTKPAPAAIRGAITALDQPGREAILGDSALMVRISAFCSHDEFLKMQLLLIYGDDSKVPLPVYILTSIMTTVPALSALKSPLKNIADADMIKIAPAVREYMEPKLNTTDFQTLSRYLHLGLLTEEEVKASYTETLQVDNKATVPIDFSPQTFTGAQGFDVGYYRDRVQVTVRIQFDANSGDARAATDLPALMTGWETAIENSWDNKFSLRNAARTLPIRVDMVYNSGKPHHHVNVGSQTNVAWPGYNTANWFYRALNYNHVNAPLHEFGHMLGNPDEYNLSAIDYARTVGKAAATDPQATSVTDVAGVVAYTNQTSLMGGGGTVEKRHLNYFTNWLNRNRQSGEPAYTLV